MNHNKLLHLSPLLKGFPSSFPYQGACVLIWTLITHVDETDVRKHFRKNHPYIDTCNEAKVIGEKSFIGLANKQPSKNQIC